MVVRYCGKECQKADWKLHKKTCVSSSMGLPLEPAPELPCECVERILWFVSRDTEGDPRVIRGLARLSKTWKLAADANATYAAMLLHRYGIEDLSVPFTRHRIEWGPNGGTLNRAPNRDFAFFDPAKIAEEFAEEFERSDKMDFGAFDFRTPTDVWTAEEMRLELTKAGHPPDVRFDASRTERFVPSPSSAAAMMARRKQKAPDARACFLEWHEDYGDVEPRLFRRMHEAWAIVENAFLTQGAPSVLSTILPGETKERCDAFARYWYISGTPKKHIINEMHPSLALLYRLRGGQMVFSPHAAMAGAGGFALRSPDAFDALSCRSGVLGGFSVYDDNRCVALFSFDHAVVWTRRFKLHELEATSDVLTHRSPEKMDRYLEMVQAFMRAPFAGSWHDAEWNSLCADVKRGTIHAHVPPLGDLAPDHPWAPPTAHPRERFGVEYDACDWFGEYANRVYDGMYRVAHDVEPFALHSMDPNAPADMSLIGPMMWRIPRSSFQGGSIDAHETTLYEHVSRGALRVTVGVAHAGVETRDDPRCVNKRPSGSNVFTYEVTFSLLSEEEQRRRFAESESAGGIETFEPVRVARLETRRWVIREGVAVFNESWFSEKEQVVEGPGVIGLHPTLAAGGESFRYRSMTSAPRTISSRVMKEFEDAAKWRVDLRMMLQDARDYVDVMMATSSMAGSFTFSTGAPGAEFEATCPEFMLQTPAYVFG